MARSDSTPYVLALDHGTSGCKVALISARGEVVAFAYEPTPLILLPGGGAEQDPKQWWSAFVAAARRVLDSSPVPVQSVQAVSVSSTFSSTVAVDRSGRALMNCLTWLDSRGAPYVKQVVAGFPSLQGYAVAKLLRWIRLTSGIPTLSGKDDIAHMLLVKHEFPAVYDKTYKFLGSKDYFNLRLTGQFAASYDSISLFWIADIRDIRRVHYDDGLIRLLQIDRELLPDLKGSTDVLGTLHPAVARELGLPESTRVVMGAPDHQCALVGSGAVRDFEGHCYLGTSSWIECLVPFKKTDILHSVASIPSAVPGRYQCINEQDVAGGCLCFFLENVLFRPGRLGSGRLPEGAYALADEVAASVPAGSRGVLFTPWLNGERTPVDSTTLRGGFHNLSLATQMEDMLRAVYEGVAYNTRWSLGHVETFTGRPFEALTLVGGGAQSELWCQILADVLDRPIRQAEDPIRANARGAAFLAAVGLGQLCFEDIPGLVRHRRIYEPNPSHRALYDTLYGEFLELYRCNRGILARLNRPRPAGAGRVA